MEEQEARKIAMRDRLLTVRRRRSPVEVVAAGEAIAEHVLACPEVRRAATVACYVSIGTEPGTGLLLESLRAAGKRVILPVLLPDDDLDWAVHTGELLPAARGMLEPPGRRLGVEAVATADAVLTPGLAVDRSGCRLGRGGGSYDRALARVPTGTFTCTLLYDGEVVPEVPCAGHDARVLAVATPSGVSRLRSERG